jgi:hypothetical protein
MTGMKRRLASCAAAVGVVVAGMGLVFVSASARQQNPQGQAAKPPVKIAGDFDKVRILPPGGPAPRTADGHVDLSGRWYPNHAGRMLQGAYRIDQSIMRQFDPAKTPQENPVFRPETADKYQHPTPYGSCPPGGTPTSITTQATEHGPLELIQVPGRVWALTEFPQTIRMIPTDGSPHPRDPDVSFNGDSRAHWEGDTLVVDTINLREDTNMDRYGSPHSDATTIVERIRLAEPDVLENRVTVNDPKAFTKPWEYTIRYRRAGKGNDELHENTCTEGLKLGK